MARLWFTPNVNLRCAPNKVTKKYKFVRSMDAGKKIVSLCVSSVEHLCLILQRRKNIKGMMLYVPLFQNMFKSYHSDNKLKQLTGFVCFSKSLGRSLIFTKSEANGAQ